VFPLFRLAGRSEMGNPPRLGSGSGHPLAYTDAGPSPANRFVVNRLAGIALAAHRLQKPGPISSRNQLKTNHQPRTAHPGRSIMVEGGTRHSERTRRRGHSCRVVTGFIPAPLPALRAEKGAKMQKIAQANSGWVRSTRDTGLKMPPQFALPCHGAARPCASLAPDRCGAMGAGWTRGGGPRQTGFHRKMHKIAQQLTLRQSVDSAPN